MKRKRFYTDNVGNNQTNERLTYLKALELKRKSGEEKEIHFLAHTEAKAQDYLDRVFENIEPDKNTTFKIVTPSTVDISRAKRIIASYGLTSEELYKIDQLTNVSVIFAHQWLKGGVTEWARIWEAEEVLSGQKAKALEAPSDLVITALIDLTRQINLSTGIGNPHDEELARAYVKALYQEEPRLSERGCLGVLISRLNWRYDHAMELVALIEKLNEGRKIRGGNRMRPSELIRNWKKFPETINV